MPETRVPAPDLLAGDLTVSPGRPTPCVSAGFRRLFSQTFGVCKGRIGESFTGVERERIITLIVGVTLGAVAGAIIESRQPAIKSNKPYVLSVDQRTGKPHLHVRGEPELE